MSDKIEYSLLIDGDNVNTSYLEPLQTYVTEALGGRIKTIHLFGKLRSSYLDDWKQAFPASSDILKYDISDGSKNSTDVRMLCVALKLYYSAGLHNFIIMSSDSDMESLIKGLADDAKVIVAYSSLKISKAYLGRLQKRGVTCVDLDKLRGPLDKSNLSQILNSMMQSYLRFKLGNQFFSYDAVIDWVVDRYPELSDIRGCTSWKDFKNIKVTFTPEGAAVEELEE